MSGERTVGRNRALGGVAVILLEIALQISGFQSALTAIGLTICAFLLFLPLLNEKRKTAWAAGKRAWGVYGESHPRRAMIFLLIAGAIIGPIVFGGIGLALRRAYQQSSPTPPSSIPDKESITPENVESQLKIYFESINGTVEKVSDPNTYFSYRLVFGDGIPFFTCRRKDRYQRYIELYAVIPVSQQLYNGLSNKQKEEFSRNVTGEIAARRIHCYFVPPYQDTQLQTLIPIDAGLTEIKYMDAAENMHADFRVMADFISRELNRLSTSPAQVKDDRLRGQIIKLWTGETANGTTMIYFLMSITNNSEPTMVDIGTATVKSSSGQIIVNDIPSTAAGGGTFFFKDGAAVIKQEDMLLEKLVTPIPRGDRVRGWLFYVLNGVSHEDFEKRTENGYEITVRFYDGAGNEYSATLVLASRDALMPHLYVPGAPDPLREFENKPSIPRPKLPMPPLSTPDKGASPP